MNCLSILLKELEVYIHQSKGIHIYDVYAYMHNHMSTPIYILTYKLIFINYLSILLRELEVYIHQSKGMVYIYSHIYEAYVYIYSYFHTYIFMHT
jgi:hypothetical protein